MRTSTAAARAYARALHDVAKGRNQTDAVARELHAFADAVAQQPGLRHALARPWIAAEVKQRVAAEVAARLGLSPLTRDFVALVARHGRGGQLADIEAAFGGLVDQDVGRIRARVRTAVPLTDSARAALRERLGRTLHGRQVVLQETVDAHMLGGFIAEIDGVIVDGSLDGQLARLRERLAKA